jgi:CRP-like cAMP-binding protein
MTDAVVKKLNQFFLRFPTTQWKKNAILISPEKKPDQIIYLTRGYVRQYASTKSGKEMTCVIYKPHTFFPMIFTLTSLPNRYYFEALSPSEGHTAPKEKVLSFLMQYPDVLADLTGRLYKGIETMLIQMENIAHGDATIRLTTMLLILAHRFGVSKSKKMVIPLRQTHLDLSHETGLARETVSRIMEKLEKEGILTYSGQQITLFDVPRLEENLPQNI